MTSSTIGDHVELQRGTTYKSALLDSTGPWLLGLGSIERDGGFRSDKLRTYGGPSADKLLVYPGDLYVSLKDVTQSGDLLGSIARVPDSISVGRMTQDTVKLIFKTDISQKYFYWLLRTPQYRQYCRSHATGTTNLGLSREDFFAFEIPELDPSRKKIVDVLEDVESKINLNRQTNQTLEHIAQAIFKSWFVDFEPTRAKIAAKHAGQDPEQAAMAAIGGKSLDELGKLSQEYVEQLKNTASLFPDALINSELGEIPEGWEWSEIGNEVSVVGGGTPSTKQKDFWEGGHINWTSPKDMSNLTDKILLETDRKITGAGLAKISSGLLPENTVLMSSRAPVGYLAISKIPVAVNQGYIAMRCEGRLSPEYVVQWADSVMDDIKQRASGTTFAEISKKNFKVIPVLVPEMEVVSEFSRIVSNFYKKITASIIETKNVSQIRDSLLPKLLSGELAVSLDEKKIGER